jgi:hypothetical protein
LHHPPPSIRQEDQLQVAVLVACGLVEPRRECLAASEDHELLTSTQVLGRRMPSIIDEIDHGHLGAQEPMPLSVVGIDDDVAIPDRSDGAKQRLPALFYDRRAPLRRGRACQHNH